MYPIPEPEELRAWIRDRGMTVGKAARLVGVDPRTARKWTAPRGSASHRAIPWNVWALLRLLAGAATVEAIILELEKNASPDPLGGPSEEVNDAE
jgi:hypothetical protein